MTLRHLLALAPLAFGVLVAYGCGQTTSGDCSDKGTCAPSGGATVDGASPDVVVDGGSSDAACPIDAGPRDNPCIVADQYGIFVSGPGGNDNNPGTKEQPVATISKGIALASNGLRRVFVCGPATYPEQVSLGPGVGTMVLFGGLSCADWSYNATTNVPLVAPPGVTACALQIANVVAHAQLVDMAIQAANASTSGGSSIAACVIGSGDVVLIRLALTAGTGANGADGPAAPGPPPNAQSGANGGDVSGGAAPTNSCGASSADTSTGGVGGNPGVPGGNGGTGLPTSGVTGVNDGAGGVGAPNNTATCESGHHGAAGQPGAAGASATILTSFANMPPWWVPQPGQPGAAGGVAQGGGGGGATSSHGGGSGGCGGCGGASPAGGTGGGSSIAFASYDSNVQLINSSLTSSAAGNGGNGGDAQPGQGGGGGGLGGGQAGSGAACSGGEGGAGGPSGAGGGGAGGVSVGIFFHGSAPDQAGTSIVSTGKAGAGGVAGDGSSTGLPGVSEAVFSL